MLPIWRDHSLTDPVRHAIANGGNAGLLWSKFFNQWPSPAHAPLCSRDNGDEDCFKPAGGEEKKQWINLFTGSRGDGQQLETFCQRQRERVQALGGAVVRYATAAPFVVGTGLEHPVENGFLWHHVLGVPYLPGSAVKGLVRAWAQHWLEKGTNDAEVVHLLGPHMQHEDHGKAGALIFFDALPCAPVKLIAEVLTPHDGGWRQGNADDAPSDWHNPVPIPYLAVDADQTFQFAVAPRPGARRAENDLNTAMQWLEDALEWIGAGARTAIGLGRFMEEGKKAQEDKARREEQRRRKEQEREASKNWRPSPGDKAMWPDAGEEVIVVAIEGDVARVRFVDDPDEEDQVSIMELKPTN